MNNKEMEAKMASFLPQKGFSFHTKNHWIKDQGVIKWDVYAPYAHSFYSAEVRVNADGIDYKIFTFGATLESCLEKATTSLRIGMARIRNTAVAIDDAIQKGIDYSEVGKLLEEPDETDN